MEEVCSLGGVKKKKQYRYIILSEAEIREVKIIHHTCPLIHCWKNPDYYLWWEMNRSLWELKEPGMHVIQPSHFTDEYPGVHKGEVICPRSLCDESVSACSPQTWLSAAQFWICCLELHEISWILLPHDSPLNIWWQCSVPQSCFLFRLSKLSLVKHSKHWKVLQILSPPICW